MSAINKAKEALLNALDQLDQAEKDLGGEAERVDLVVVYSIGRGEDDGWHEIGGWSTTSGPKWLHVSLMRRAADAQEEAIVAVDDEEPEE